LFRILLAALALLSLSPAFAKEQVPFHLGTTLPIDIVLTQTQLAVELPDQGAGRLDVTDALAWVIVDAQLDRARQRALPLRDVLSSYDFGGSLEKALRARLPADGLATAPEIAAVHGARFSQAPEGGALLLYPTLVASRNFERITVRMTAIYLYRTVDKKGRESRNARFGRDYSYALVLPHASGNSASEDAKRWAGLGAAELTALLDKAAGEVVEMLAYDFSPAGRLEFEKPMAGDATTRFAGKEYGARALRRTDRSIWLRYGKASDRKIEGLFLVGDRPELTAPAPAAALPAHP
jgi:hypothetical protein